MTLNSKCLARTLEALCYIQSTVEEMAAYLGSSVRRVEQLKKDPAFAEIFTRASAQGKMAIRRAQWKKALEGDTKMLIWLGQQVLGQWGRPSEGGKEEPVQDRLSVLRRILDNLSDTEFREWAKELGVELPAEDDPSLDVPGNCKVGTREWNLKSVPDEVFAAESNRRGQLSRRAGAESS